MVQLWLILVIHKIWLRFQHIYHDRLSYHSQFIKNILLTLVHVIILLYAAIFYLHRRADLTASAASSTRE